MINAANRNVLSGVVQSVGTEMSMELFSKTFMKQKDSTAEILAVSVAPIQWSIDSSSLHLISFVM